MRKEDISSSSQTAKKKKRIGKELESHRGQQKEMVPIVYESFKRQ